MAPNVCILGASDKGLRRGQGVTALEPCRCAERFLDPQALVPLGHALRAAERADLELVGTPADREMDDRGVLASPERAETIPAMP